MNLLVQRKLTQEFIQMLPTTVVLTPNTRVRTPSGGYQKQPQAPRAPLTVTIIEPGVDPQPTVTQDGIVRVVSFEVLGEWDAPMAIDDSFVHQGKDWEIVALFYNNQYETRAWVAARG